MKQLITVIIILLAFVSASTAQNVIIGKQVWTSKNLDVDHFRNGDLIPQAKTAKEWKKADENNQPAWCYPNNKITNGKKYGKLYNWYALNDPRGLAPSGWHVPDETEWNSLFNTFGGLGLPETGIKIKNNSGWKKSWNGTNESGFAALPGGYRAGWSNYGFNFCHTGAEWWSKTSINMDEAMSFFLFDWNHNQVLKTKTDKSTGASVRCIKD